MMPHSHLNTPTRTRQPWRRLVGVCAVLALTAGIVGDLGTETASVAAAADPSAPVAQIALDRAVYDRYEPVVVELGAIGFFPTCPGGGIRDFIYPWADIYIVRGALTPTALTDVNGAPNAVIGFGGGGFFDEVIGYAGVGGLTSGTYSIVVDECQDGRLDANDSVFLNEFRVTTRTSVAPMNGIGSLKAEAGRRADEWAARGRDWQILLAMNEALQYVTPFLSNPPLLAVGIGIAQFFSSKVTEAATTAFFPDPKTVAATQFTNMSRHYRGIQNDPPDPNYLQLTTLRPAIVHGAVHDDPIFASAADISAVAAAEEVLAEALLHSIERYQGAAAQGDGDWALRHVRQAEEFANLLATQLRASAAVYGQAAADLENDPRPLDETLASLGAEYNAMFAAGLDAQQEALIARSGATRQEMTDQLASLWRLDMASTTVADLAATLRSLQSGAGAFAADLDAFAADNQSVIAALEADPFTPDAAPVVDAGGPYATSIGVPITLTATATTGGDAAIVAFAWDTDGDGAFDDGAGATISATPAVPRTGLVGVKVTDAIGDVGVDYAPIAVTGDVAATAVSSAPAEGGVEVAIGASQVFSFVAPQGETRWLLDGVEQPTGTDFTFSPTPSDAGVHRVSAGAPTGLGIARDWTVYAVHPDIDDDGYPSNLDCNDNDPAIYPGAPELLDGKDNDCIAGGVDGGTDPAVDGIVAPPGAEGAVLTLTADIDPSGATAPFTATVDWGDGTSSAGTVSGSGVNTKITATHAYRDNDIYPVEVCARSQSGRTGCASGAVTVTNVAAVPDFVNLFGWSDEGRPIPSDGGAANWVVASDGKSVVQTLNSDPGFFVSDQPLIGTEAQVTISMLPQGDDDFVGFVVGVEPGFATRAGARWLLVDWKAGTQGYGCGGNALRGLAVSYVEGLPSDTEIWAHSDCDPQTPGKVTEIARAATRGSTGWEFSTPYQFRIRYTPTRLQVFVNNVLEFDLGNELINPGGGSDITFPQGRLGFYNYSQGGVTYSAYEVSALYATEGVPLTVAADFIDPGVDDTHIGRFDFGDGTPEEAATIVETGGRGDASTVHSYAQDGSYPSELCITDDDDGTGCREVVVQVANAAPVVDAGRDRTGGPTFTLDDTTFGDPGVLDTHSATIDWGDGSPVVAVAAPSTLGRGTVAGTHTYTGDGERTVTICVTDEQSATGCDTFTATISAAAAPQAAISDATTIAEGAELEYGIGFIDANTSDAPSAVLAWGDGSSTTVDAQRQRGAGSGSAKHSYRDNGVFTAAVQVCDTTTCTTASNIVTVDNVAPSVTVELSAGAVPLSAIARAPFTDPGVDDTHTATIDWGDGTVDPAVPIGATPGPGISAIASGQVAGAHTYAEPGEHRVEVCVTDDDSGRTCAAGTITLAPAAAVTTEPAPVTTEAPTPSTTTAPPTSTVVGGAPAAATTTTSIALEAPIGNVLPTTGTNVVQLLWLGFSILTLGSLTVRLRRWPRRG